MELGLFSLIIGIVFSIIFLVISFFSGVVSLFLFLAMATFYHLTYPGMFMGWHIGLFLVGLVAVSFLDFWGSYFGAKVGKATAYGFWSSIVGGVVGFLSGGILGSIVGTFVGCLLGELVFSAKTLKEASRASMVITLGMLLGAVLRTVVCLSLFIFFVVKLFQF